jgi:hypothetical protein
MDLVPSGLFQVNRDADVVPLERLSLPRRGL